MSGKISSSETHQALWMNIYIFSCAAMSQRCEKYFKSQMRASQRARDVCIRSENTYVYDSQRYEPLYFIAASKHMYGIKQLRRESKQQREVISFGMTRVYANVQNVNASDGGMKVIAHLRLAYLLYHRNLFLVYQLCTFIYHPCRPCRPTVPDFLVTRLTPLKLVCHTRSNENGGN